jgi:hypothetical protein
VSQQDLLRVVVDEFGAVRRVCGADHPQGISERS